MQYFNLYQCLSGLWKFFESKKNILYDWVFNVYVLGLNINNFERENTYFDLLNIFYSQLLLKIVPFGLAFLRFCALTQHQRLILSATNHEKSIYINISI